MACRFSYVDDDCWEFCSLFLWLFSLSHPGNVGIFLCYNQMLYKWQKWLYYINICINKTLYVVNRDTLCAALSCSLCLFLFLSSNVIKNINCQPQFVYLYTSYVLIACFFIKLRFEKQPEEGSPAAHTEGSSWAAVHLPLFLLSANRGVSCAIRLIGRLLTSRALRADPI